MSDCCVRFGARLLALLQGVAGVAGERFRNATVCSGVCALRGVAGWWCTVLLRVLSVLWSWPAGAAARCCFRVLSTCLVLGCCYRVLL